MKNIETVLGIWFTIIAAGIIAAGERGWTPVLIAVPGLLLLLIGTLKK